MSLLLGAGALSKSRNPIPGLQDLQIWYAADRLTTLTNGSSIRVINDLSSNARNSSASTGGITAPTVVANSQNGLPTISFNGAQASSFSALTLDSWTIAVVYAVTGSTATPYIIGSTSATVVLMAPTSGIATFYNYSDTFDDYGTSGLTDGSTANFHIVVAGRDTSGTHVCFVDGADRTKAHTNLSAQTVALFLGKRITGAGTSEFIGGNIGEIAIYSTIHSTANMQAIMSYLNSKWSVY